MICSWFRWMSLLLPLLLLYNGELWLCFLLPSFSLVETFSVATAVDALQAALWLKERQMRKSTRFITLRSSRDKVITFHGFAHCSNLVLLLLFGHYYQHYYNVIVPPPIWLVNSEIWMFWVMLQMVLGVEVACLSSWIISSF